MYLSKEIKERFSKNTENQKLTQELQKDKLLCSLTELTTCQTT